MQYSPKLKMAMEEIKAVLKKHDIAGSIILHTPGFGEYAKVWEPSYSCVKLEGNGQFRFRAKAEDFGGSKEKRNEVLQSTANMLSILGTLVGREALQLLELSKILDKHIGAQHDDGNHSSHDQQNN